jgi:hypothetical protein
MTKRFVIEPEAGEATAVSNRKDVGITVRLAFAMEPNQKAPELIRELLRSSYLKRMVRENDHEL